MSKPVPRSRLNITYRTRIEGKPKKVKLPMRFLVLGDFTGGNDTMLSERPMHSLLPGMKIDSFMHEMKVAAPIDDPSLQQTLKGRLEGSVSGKIGKTKPAGDGSDPDKLVAEIELTGTGIVSGEGKDNGLGSFRGEVQLSGSAEFAVQDDQVVFEDGADPITVLLRVKGKVEPPGDFDAGITGTVDTSIEVQVSANALTDADELNEVDVRFSTDATTTEGEGEEAVTTTTPATVDVSLTIPLRSIGDFRPNQLAANVPEIRRLVLLQRLVLELRGYISGSPMLRDALKEVLSDTKKAVLAKKEDGSFETPATDTALGKLEAALTKDFPQLKAPELPAEESTGA